MTYETRQSMWVGPINGRMMRKHVAEARTTYAIGLGQQSSVLIASLDPTRFAAQTWLFGDDMSVTV